MAPCGLLKSINAFPGRMWQMTPKPGSVCPLSSPIAFFRVLSVFCAMAILVVFVYFVFFSRVFFSLDCSMFGCQYQWKWCKKSSHMAGNGIQCVDGEVKTCSILTHSLTQWKVPYRECSPRKVIIRDKLNSPCPAQDIFRDTVFLPQ